ncbi:MAG: hypothetical protein V1660_00635 [archaeon]
MVKKKILKKEVKTKKSTFKAKLAYVLFIVSEFFLFGSSIFMILFRNDVLAAMEESYNLSISEFSIITYSIIWIVIGLFAWISNYRIRKDGNRNQKWMFFLWSIITMIGGNIEAGIPLLISSILYLRDS